MRCDLAASTTLPGDLQRIIEALQEHLHGPGKRHVGLGHHYNNIQNSGGYSHYGDNYFFNGALPIALIEAMATKLDGTASMLHIGRALPIGEDSRDVSPQGVAFAHAVNDNTPGPSANVQPLAPQTTHLSAMELTNLLSQCHLELSRTKLDALLAMLLWIITDLRTCVRCLTVIIRLPKMLLHNNITLVDALNREVSLPYQWFRTWPHMLAHLQYEFRGTPVNSSFQKASLTYFEILQVHCYSLPQKYLQINGKNPCRRDFASSCQCGWTWTSSTQEFAHLANGHRRRREERMNG